MTPQASVIVPSYRGAVRLPQLLDAFAQQADGCPSFEVIVVIDGVDDGSVALIEAESRFPIRHILFPENRGRVAALNAGFEAACGEVLIRCDDDLVPAPDYIVQHLRQHEGRTVGVVGLYRNVYDTTPYAEAYGREMDRVFRTDAYRASPDLTWRYWAGNCSISRSTWNRIGAYDPDYRLYGWEDVDYGYRLHAAGIPVLLEQSLETTHRVAAVTTKERARRAAHAAGARRIFERKHPDHPLPSAVPGNGAWNSLVRVSSVTLARRPAVFGAAVDRIIAVMPRPIAKKLVALAVESSALAGYRNDEIVKEVF